MESIKTWFSNNTATVVIALTAVVAFMAYKMFANPKKR